MSLKNLLFTLRGAYSISLFRCPGRQGRLFARKLLKSLIFFQCFLPTAPLCSESLPEKFTYESKLIASDGQSGDHFSQAMAMHGNTLLVGAGDQDMGGVNSGAVYVYDRDYFSNKQWAEIGKLAPVDNQPGKLFGVSVAIQGDTAVVGAIGDKELGADSGAVYIFYFSEGDWTQHTKIFAADSTAGDRFGVSVAISGDLIIVGAHNHDAGGMENAGAVYLFSRHHGGADNWGQVGKLLDAHGAAGDRFGAAVAIDGDTIVVGADYKEAELRANYVVPANYLPRPRFTFTKLAEGFCGIDVGAVFVFDRQHDGNEQLGQRWEQVTQFTLFDGECSDRFGGRLALSGDTIAVGVPVKDIFDLLYSGRVYIYERNQGGANYWGETAVLANVDAREGDHFGSGIALQGDLLIVGAESDDDVGFGAGSATLFQRKGTEQWEPVERFYASDANSQDRFGGKVAISDQAIAVGATEDAASGFSSGSVYTFHDGPPLESAATYSFVSGMLSLTAVEVPGLGIFQASLSRDSPDGLLFTVDELQKSGAPESAYIANYHAAYQWLHIPSVDVVDEFEQNTSYVVDLRLTKGSPLQFELTRVRLRRDVN